MIRTSGLPMQTSSGNVRYHAAAAGDGMPQTSLLDVLAELRRAKTPCPAHAPWLPPGSAGNPCYDEAPFELPFLADLPQSLDRFTAQLRRHVIDADGDEGTRLVPSVAIPMIAALSALLWLAVLGA